ncbi:MAG: cyclopropane-fatty-acyl-phospholipid synthase family protein [Kangiellaceae bacterium]|jgi:cyclopropane-fatty-acyl-phospholipid synthase|nr:cyclopropane-fatty-acyl-phospholipid synthase family protein [Kangiellaceae bacterium]
MEKVANSIETKKPSAYAQVCRKIVFALLDKMTTASLRVHEPDEAGDGITTLGNPNAELSAQLNIHDPNVFIRFVKGGSIGAAEGFIDGEWSSPNLTHLIQVFARSQSVLDDLESKMTWLTSLKNKLFHRKNNNSISGSKNNILAHYDLGNELYTRFLDPEMMYSSAIYSDGIEDLDTAQLNKLKTICERLELKATDKLVEIGTGWGGLAIFAAKNYGCHVTTTTISDAQHEYAKARIESLGLQDKITLLKQDYRKLTGQFDKLVSIEMIEAVGHEYFATFFAKCNDLVKPGGKLLIQAITIADQRYEYYKNNVDFIQRYIFPGGCLPSIEIMSKHISKQTKMVIEGIHDIGLDYATTLEHWRERFNHNWHEIKEHGYDDKFKRLWLYYLCYCEGAFLERATSAVHMIARK